MADKEIESAREFRKRAELGRILVKEDVQARIKLITKIMRKEESLLTEEEKQILKQSPDVVQDVLKRQERSKKQLARAQEIEDAPHVLEQKCIQLSQALKRSKCSVVYTGAGISTAACIPDYRGPNGVWTLLQKGQKISHRDLSEAEPTLTHMALSKLRKKGLIYHIVSQNCDGLHLRSNIPISSLSEVHGNMYMEVCRNCRPPRQYIRLFDVTERTALYKHKTGRKCHYCDHCLVDTIVHFGEKGTLKSPLNWKGAVSAVEKCDLILCLGSSLKVLRKYSCLWVSNKPLHSRPHLYIVNLQWTPKDHVAALKINGRCDDVMKIIMKHLGLKIPVYKIENDPLFKLATHLRIPEELNTTTRKSLSIPPNSSDVHKNSVRPSAKCTFIKDESSTSDSLYDCSNIINNVASSQTNCDSACKASVISDASNCDSEDCKKQSPRIEDYASIPSTSSGDSIVYHLKDNANMSSDKFVLPVEETSLYSSSDLSLNNIEIEEVTVEVKSEPDVSVQVSEKEIPQEKPCNTAGWFGKGYRKPRKKKRKLH